MHNAKHMVLILMHQRVARMPCSHYLGNIFFKTVFNVQAYHILTRHHNFTRHAVGKVKNIIKQAAFHMVKLAALFTGAYYHTQLFLTARNIFRRHLIHF